MEKREEKVYTAFRCPTDLLERVQVEAKSHRRSVSNYIVWLLERELER